MSVRTGIEILSCLLAQALKESRKDPEFSLLRKFLRQIFLRVVQCAFAKDATSIVCESRGALLVELLFTNLLLQPFFFQTIELSRGKSIRPPLIAFPNTFCSFCPLIL